jgi:5'-nucleotidase
MRQTVHILVTNDDGITSPGLSALAEVMRNLGEVSILAPDRDWSGRGHVKTLKQPLRVSEVTLRDGSLAYASDGAPSDCVALALLGYISPKIDLVVSGINPAANLGHDVTYLGTVTAAMEAVIWGVPGIAFSLDSSSNLFAAQEFQPAAIIAEIIAGFMVETGLPGGILLNVNIPGGNIRGIKATRQGLRVYRDQLEERYDPRGNSYYWFAGEAPSGIPEQGTDIGALAAGYVSLTPLHLDLTAHQTIDKINIWQQEYNFPIHELETRSNGRS